MVAVWLLWQLYGCYGSYIVTMVATCIWLCSYIRNVTIMMVAIVSYIASYMQYIHGYRYNGQRSEELYKIDMHDLTEAYG